MGIHTQRTQLMIMAGSFKHSTLTRRACVRMARVLVPLALTSDDNHPGYDQPSKGSSPSPSSSSPSSSSSHHHYLLSARFELITALAPKLRLSETLLLLGDGDGDGFDGDGGGGDGGGDGFDGDGDGDDGDGDGGGGDGDGGDGDGGGDGGDGGSGGYKSAGDDAWRRWWWVMDGHHGDAQEMTQRRG